ncbi:hypothetical protein CKAH01_05325 [Colletotrichum kahawae]|uniref:Uncharacterized protein n=1 Tax=Colletotrichum kahawae TaxID=34407 RepID=A0AAD9YG41_COLKA|nr:hypothetical protein CKAH01_05325 [Colletotrichum kahawae]
MPLACFSALCICCGGTHHPQQLNSWRSRRRAMNRTSPAVAHAVVSGLSLRYPHGCFRPVAGPRQRPSSPLSLSNFLPPLIRNITNHFWKNSRQRYSSLSQASERPGETSNGCRLLTAPDTSPAINQHYPYLLASQRNSRGSRDWIERRILHALLDLGVVYPYGASSIACRVKLFRRHIHLFS